MACSCNTAPLYHPSKQLSECLEDKRDTLARDFYHRTGYFVGHNPHKTRWNILDIDVFYLQN